MEDALFFYCRQFLLYVDLSHSLPSKIRPIITLDSEIEHTAFNPTMVPQQRLVGFKQSSGNVLVVSYASTAIVIAYN